MGRAEPCASLSFELLHGVQGARFVQSKEQAAHAYVCPSAVNDASYADVPLRI